MVRPAAPAKTMQAKKQRVLEAPSAAARQAARLAAHSRYAHLPDSLVHSCLRARHAVQ